MTASAACERLDCSPLPFSFLYLDAQSGSFAGAYHHCVVGCLGTGHGRLTRERVLFLLVLPVRAVHRCSFLLPWLRLLSTLA